MKVGCAAIVEGLGRLGTTRLAQKHQADQVKNKQQAEVWLQNGIHVLKYKGCACIPCLEWDGNDDI